MKPSVLVTHLWFANTIGTVAGRIANVPVVLPFEQNVYDNVKSRRQFFTDKILQRLRTRTVAISEAVRDSLVRNGIREENIVVIPSAINLERYRSAKPVDRSILGAGRDDFIFLFVGRLIRQKGVDILIEAFSSLKSGILLMAGEGEDRKKLELQASAAGLKERVRFLGVRNDIPALLKSADCFVFPSRWEGLGLVVLEAMAAGLPIIVSDFDAGKTMIKDGRNGTVVPKENAKELAGAMQRAIMDERFRKELAKNAFEDAEFFSISAHINSLLQLVDECDRNKKRT